jgi:hypothetical protein
MRTTCNHECAIVRTDIDQSFLYKLYILNTRDDDSGACMTNLFHITRPLLNRGSGHPAALPKARYAMPFFQALAVVTMRQLRLTLRETAVTRGRWIQVSLADYSKMQCSCWASHE